MKLITRALIVIVIPFWGEPWHGTDSMVGKRGEVVVVGAFERNISCGVWPAIAKGVIQNTRVEAASEDAGAPPPRPRSS